VTRGRVQGRGYHTWSASGVCERIRRTFRGTTRPADVDADLLVLVPKAGGTDDGARRQAALTDIAGYDYVGVHFEGVQLSPTRRRTPSHASI
jgi:hypothetical protein